VWPTKAETRYCCTCLSLGIIGSSIEKQWANDKKNLTEATETAYKAPVVHWCICSRHLCNQACRPQLICLFELLIVQHAPPCTWLPNQHSGNADKALKSSDPGFFYSVHVQSQRFPFVLSWL
jgi:hypothetical protein